MSHFEQNCTLLVNSCDSYEDSWNGFFDLLRIQWPDFDMDVVLNTETKTYAYAGLNIKTMQLAKKGMPWGKRLMETLKRIDTKYILFALDDFYLNQPVRVDEIRKCYQYMEENPGIAYFSFLPTEDRNNIASTAYPGFERRPQKGEYRLNCQFALWNRESLLSFIRPHESPWEWELYGSRRSSRYQQEMYTIAKSSTPVFSYENGEVIMRGRWYLSRVQPLIRQYGLSIDLSQRESYEDFLSRPQIHKRNVIRGVKNRIHKLMSLL